MQTKNARATNEILEYLKRMPFAKASAIQKGIKTKVSNIYGLLQVLVDRGAITKKGLYYSLSNNGANVTNITKTAISKPYTPPPPAPNPLITVYSREIKFVEDGIDSLMITKSYLLRRVEQLKQEDARHAGSN